MDFFLQDEPAFIQQIFIHEMILFFSFKQKRKTQAVYYQMCHPTIPNNAPDYITK